MPAKTHEPTWGNVDLHNPEEIAAFRQRQTKRAGKRVQAAVKKLQAQGILDATERRVRSTIPADMREGSKTDFGG